MASFWRFQRLGTKRGRMVEGSPCTGLHVRAALVGLLLGACTAFVPPPSQNHRTLHQVCSAKEAASEQGSRASMAAQVDDAFTAKKEALKKVLRREYASFFNPMERGSYTPDVEFIDPMISIRGVDAYQKNVDFLGARTMLGKVLFSDQGIVLHKFDDLGPRQLQTRWTLRLRAKLLPWSPTARFTGVSIYDLNDDAKVIRQTDYWDSVNLEGKGYKVKPALEGAKDFLQQLAPQSQAQAAMNSELPYELLRRTQEYEVRRYPAYTAIETTYQTRPEGYDRLGTYVGGWNEENRKVRPFSPSLISVTSEGKDMRWPLGFSNEQLGETGGSLSDVPTPSSDILRRVTVPSQTVAVLRFDNPATEPVVKYYSGRLQELLSSAGLVPVPNSPLIVAQYDAIFSIGTRRNEVWAVLDKHDWE